MFVPWSPQRFGPSPRPRARAPWIVAIASAVDCVGITAATFLPPPWTHGYGTALLLLFGVGAFGATRGLTKGRAPEVLMRVMLVEAGLL